VTTTRKPRDPSAVLVTGLAGNLGQHLARELRRHLLVGVDLHPPRVDHPRVQFCPLDLSHVEATQTLVELMEEYKVRQVFHLAFVLDPMRTGSLSSRRQWEINVRGTAHLLDALEEVNRERRKVELLLYPSSVTTYGPELAERADEHHPQRPHTYPYALHKMETEELCRVRFPRLHGCAVYIVRGHIFLGRQVENFIVRALQGQPSRRTGLGRWLERRGWRLPLLFPSGERYRGRYQFMHIEDAARLLAWLGRHFEPGKLEILNAQGRGTPLTAEECAHLAGLHLVRLPSYRLVRWLYRLFWTMGVSPVPAEAFPYFVGSYVMSTERLERLLGKDYKRVVQWTTEQAYRETFAG
jgi:nucleoside-diphosphate-sugar epimerase